MFQQAGIISVSALRRSSTVPGFLLSSHPQGQALAILCAMGGTGVGTADTLSKRV